MPPLQPKAATPPVAENRGSSKAGPVLAVVARGERPPLPSKAEAATRFLAMLQDELGAGEMRFSIVMREYARFAGTNGLPMMTEMALSLSLKALGCRSEERDFRSSGGGRPRWLVWPEAAVAEPPSAAVADRRAA